MTRRALVSALFATLGLLAAAAPARAGLLPVGVTIAPEGGTFRWTYTVTLPTDSQLKAGDYFTVYDFAGMVPGGATMPDGWSFASGNVGPTPDRLNPLDDPTVPNLTFTYTGPTIANGRAELGEFSAVSLFGGTADADFTAVTHRFSDGKTDSNITTTTVPVPAPGVPEPTTLALALFGLPLAGAARVLRRRK